MLLTPREVATELRITPAAVYAFVRRGTLPAVHVGRCVRIDRAALEAFLRTGREAPRDARPGVAR
jgi:excisionase family DNA binding protein